MITNGIVINDLDSFEKIVLFAKKRKEYFINYYSEEYAMLIDTLDRFVPKCRENLSKEGFNQNVIDFSLKTTGMFKTIIYLYLKQNNPTIKGVEMEFITNTLERLDDWISENMNTEDYYLRGVVNYSGFKTEYYE